MNCSAFLLAVSVFVAMFEVNVACTTYLSCTTTFTSSVSANPTESTLCRAYSNYKTCLTNICGSYYPPDAFDYADQILTSYGISCNAGRNAQFSLPIILGFIFIAFSICH